MTTYFKEYELTAEQRLLLRDLIVYMISHGDARVAHGESFPYRTWRSSGREILSMLNDGKEVKGFDCIIFTMRDAAELCRVVPDGTRDELRRNYVTDKEDEGLNSILYMHSNETIEGLKRILMGDPVMSSTNNFNKCHWL